MPKAKRRKAGYRTVPEQEFNKVTGAWIKESVDWLLEKECGCCHFKVWEDPDGREYDVCIGWHDGYDPDDKDLMHSGDDPGWCIAWKIAYQDPGNACQCDFDVDWIMPYDPDRGDVYDTCAPMLKPRNEALWHSYADMMNSAACLSIRFDQEMKG